jgi:hypothetical protein
MWRTSPGELIRARYLRGEIDEEEAERRLRVLAGLTALLLPALLISLTFAFRALLFRDVLPTPLLLRIAAVLAPIGPLFALAVHLLVERPAFRAAVERRKSLG